jgi:hypothetical protein
MGNVEVMHLGALARKLTELRPDHYNGLNSTKLGPELRKAGVKDTFKLARTEPGGKPGRSVRREQLNVSATAVTGDDEDPEFVTDAVTDVTEADED